MMPSSKLDINLLTPDLFPKQPLFTLNRLVFIWILLLASMFVWGVFNHYQLTQLKQTERLVKQQNNQKTQLLEQIQQEIQTRKKDPSLAAKLTTLQTIMRHKQGLHAKLTDPNQTDVAGFADAMTELSKHHHKGIHLQKVLIATEQIALSGLAKSPESVPQWLSGFEQSNLLAGKRFEHFYLYENDDKVTVFNIATGSDIVSEAQ